MYVMMTMSTFSLGVTKSHNKVNVKLPLHVQWPPLGTEESGGYKEVAVVKRF